MFVHTAHGAGRVVDEQSVRGRKSFLVEGKGFKVWVDEKDLRVANDVNHDNSTTLPYDPTPQHPTDMFKSESTIQPINDIDPDETLSASDSLTFEDAAEYPYPGPSSENFAKNAGFLEKILDKLPRHEWNEKNISDWVERRNPNYHPEEEVRLVHSNHSLDMVRMPPQGYRGKHRPPPAPELSLGNGHDVWDSQDWLDAHPEPQLGDPREQARYQEWKEKYLGDRQLGDRGLNTYEPIYANRMDFDDEDIADDDHEEIKHFSSRTAAMYEDFAEDPLVDAAEDAVDEQTKKRPNPKKIVNEGGGSGLEGVLGEAESLLDDFAGDGNKKQVGGYWPGRPDGQTVTSSLYERPAGLSDRYIRVEAHVDHYSDPVQQFRDDPVGFINKRGYMFSDATDIRLAEYIDLVEHDPGIRTAAWRDVRSKALRLRREGRVHVKDLAHDRIYASVDGDSDTYETMILKGAGNGQSISDWHCSCPWGRWAFKRQMSYVGRLCSHGYASYLEMESQQMKANNKRRKNAGSICHADPSEQEGVGDMNWGAWKRRNLDENGEVIGNPNSRKERERSRDEAYQDWIHRGAPHHGSRTAGIVEDFKEWADNENDGMIDQQAIDNFIYLLNSQQDGDHTIVSEEDAEKLYDALDGMKSTGKVRDYDVDYLERPGDVYKDASFHEADVLHLRPQSLTPDFYFVEDGQDGQSWTDVTKDERKTTGPDNMVRKSRRLTGRELHYASDEELGKAVKDWAGASSKLEKLRDLSAEEPDLQNMRDKNEEIRDVINELHDRGIDASQFVASLRFAADAEEDAADDPTKKKPASQQGQPDMSGKPSQTGQPGGSSSITKPETSQGTSGSGANASSSSLRGGLENQKNDPAAMGFNSYPATNPVQSGGQGNDGMNISPGDVMSGLGQAAGYIRPILESIPSIANSIGQIGTGIGTGISGLVNGLSGLKGIRAGATDHLAVPVGGFPNVQLTNQESFQGSGPNPKYWMGSSECYVDEHERDRFVDVTDLDDDPIIKYTGEKPKQGPKKSGSRHPFVSNDHYANSENQNPEGATLTSGSGMNDTGVVNLDQVHKAGSTPHKSKPWDGNRVRDFRRYVKQNGGQQPTHLMLQQYLNSKSHRGLDQGGIQHLQDYTSNAEQHEANLRQAAEEPGAADVPGFDDDGSDIVAQFHRMGGIEAINNSGGGTYSDSAIAEQARGFLRTAGRMYSLAEQRELENEAHPKGARNLDELDLAGTHYEDAL